MNLRDLFFFPSARFYLYADRGPFRVVEGLLGGLFAGRVDLVMISYVFMVGHRFLDRFDASVTVLIRAYPVGRLELIGVRLGDLARRTSDLFPLLNDRHFQGLLRRVSNDLYQGYGQREGRRDGGWDWNSRFVGACLIGSFTGVEFCSRLFDAGRLGEIVIRLGFVVCVFWSGFILEVDGGESVGGKGGHVLRVTVPSVVSGVAIPLLKLVSIAVIKRLKTPTCVKTVTMNNLLFGVVC